jgi:hypothetical protein
MKQELLQTYQINYMQTERKVFEKLFSPDKVELESQKVELALADDIEASRNESIKYADSSKALYNKAQAGLIQYVNSLANVVQASNRTVQYIKDLKQKSAGLGVEVGGKWLSIEKEASQQAKDYTAKFKAIDTMVKSM